MFNYDGKELVVGNFKKIISILGDKIVFEYKRFNLTIDGNKLNVIYLEDNELGIGGIIKNISFSYKLVNSDD